ncbi:MAG: Flp pilus assembly complex ATPase component TadA [Proteobacteria bacterium]|nr:Flp pilus assembly complex ATPase component TadA [Pseudomonadota bacterium]
MSDLSALPIAVRDALASAPMPAHVKLSWPDSPVPGYPPFQADGVPEACVVESLAGKTRQLLLAGVDWDKGLAYVMVPPARETMPLGLAQCRRLTLSAPLRPLAATPVAQPFEVELKGDGRLRGETMGHVANQAGLYLFVKIDATGGVRRVFLPGCGIVQATVDGQPLHTWREALPAEAALEPNLVTRAIYSVSQLTAALAAQSRMPMVRIGEALIGLSLITPEQLNAAIAQQQSERGVPLGELLVRAGHITRNDLRVALARKMGYPVVDLEAFPVDVEALRAIPHATARRLSVLPLCQLDGKTVIAIEDPSRRAALDELQFLCQTKVLPVIPATENLEAALQTAYARHGLDESASAANPNGARALAEGGTEHLLAQLEEQYADLEINTSDEASIEQADNSLVRLINTMIVKAHGQGVSDIHIETQPGRERVLIRFRRDGVLKPYLELPHTYRSALVARIKIMCDLDISERRRPQDGKINFARFVPGCNIELRVATIPTSNNLEDVVMRILASAKPIPLDNLGLSPRNLEALKYAIQRPYGMVLCVGPTGSGKTTTLHSALSFINTPDRKIWTAEDPVEITQVGLRQVQVNPKIDWTFAKALRAFLRADPDVIMVGEIRDEETAEIAVESSLTGHLVLSTLHTNSAPETVTRLLDMGMDPFNFADSLLAILAQRLVRRLCSGCRTSQPLSDEATEELLTDYLKVWADPTQAPERGALRTEWRQRFGKDGQLQAWHAPGCDKCEGSGVKGRAGLHELLAMSRELRAAIQGGARAEEIQRLALSQGMRTLRQDGIEKVLAGITSIEEVRATSNT